ncbi:hypothetical protein Cpir12675_006019 [Ceratocystis pirilliformis]|uniref:J domain-containing protein n=1 Tax=Ceratocystis pirilliformis TaxID=259994 RepID=A0ABR3YN87_9PEZI
MSSRAPPDYYAILEIPENASTQKIRDAYKKAALKTHPDRVAADHPERPARTRKFQLVNDAYYTLSDPSRRREYDAQRRLFQRPGAPHGSASAKPDPFDDPFAEFDSASPPPFSSSSSSSTSTPFSWAWNFFSGGSSAADQEKARAKAEETQFADVFEEMLHDEGLDANGEKTNNGGRFWGAVGGVSGGALGFIIGNFPGLVMGAAAGNRLGAVRDDKGKSVYEVFQDLPAHDKSRLLATLAAKVLSQSVGL